MAGIKSATPSGLVVQIKKDDAPISIPWSKLDLDKLKEGLSQVHAAHLAALGGRTVELNLGSFGSQIPGMTGDGEVEFVDRKVKKEAEGLYEVDVSPKTGETFQKASLALRIVPGRKPKAILVVSQGMGGNGLLYATADSAGILQPFLNANDLAIMGTFFHAKAADRSVIPYYLASKGSGRAVEDAIKQIADRANMPELAEVPLLIYGRDIGGAAFAYNFTQWKPERVVGAVAAKGAFLAHEATEASAKVPLLLIVGEFDNTFEFFQAAPLPGEVFGRYADKKPLWTYALEPHAGADFNQSGYDLATSFLQWALNNRLKEDGSLADIERTEGYVGNAEDGSYEKLEEDIALPTTQTWLPSDDFAKAWSKFVTGTF